MWWFVRRLPVVIGVVGVVCCGVESVGAQSLRTTRTVEPMDISDAEVLMEVEVASESADASGSAREASASGGLVRLITEKSNDLTETQGEAKGKLERLVLETRLDELNWHNFLRWSIQSAVRKGVPANTLVLLLMFPIITTLIAASRNLVGLRGFGIFTPALVAVGFLATGLITGFFLFFVILGLATAGRVVIRKLKLPYMPRTSLLLWFVSIGVLLVLLISPHLPIAELAQLSIFPILLMVLLAETFIEVQSKRNRGQAIEMTLETLLLAVISYFLMNLQLVQEFVLLHSELMVVSVAIFNVFLGRFSGLRLLEYWTFKQLLK